MKTRRIPPTAEKVYTYTLNRAENNQNKPKPHATKVSDPKNKPEQQPKANPSKPASSQGTSVPSGKSRERAENNDPKSGGQEILAWGNTDEETQAFYDEMLEHESGDGEHDETQAKTDDQKVSTDHSASAYAKTRFLNTPHEGDPAPDQSSKDSVIKTHKPADDRFLEGDQEENNTPKYEA